MNDRQKIRGRAIVEGFGFTEESLEIRVHGGDGYAG